MTVKALKNQLMAAIAMTLVAAVSLGSSTFAWFASRTTATATSMTINAQSDAKFLEITTLGTNFTGSTSTSAALTPTSNLYPVTPFYHTSPTSGTTTDLNIDTNTIQWYYTYSDSASSAGPALGATWFKVGDTGRHTAEQSYLTNDFYFRMNVSGATGSKLVASAAQMTDVTSGNLAESLSVVLQGPNGFQVIKYSSGGTPAITYYDTSGSVVADLASFSGLVSTVSYVDADAVSTASKVSVYVYFDGDNVNVTSNKLSAAVSGIVNSITFSVT